MLVHDGRQAFRNLTKEAQDIQLRKAHQKIKRKEGAQYMCSMHRYEYLRDGIHTGIFRSMLGREANKLNTKYINNFGDNKVPVLSHWFWCKPENKELNV